MKKKKGKEDVKNDRTKVFPLLYLVVYPQKKDYCKKNLLGICFFYGLKLSSLVRFWKKKL